MTPEFDTKETSEKTTVTMNLAAKIDLKGTPGSISEWFKLVRPAPTGFDFRVQLGVHLEEVREMFDEICLEGEAQERWAELNTKLPGPAEFANPETGQHGVFDALGDKIGLLFLFGRNSGDIFA